MKKVFGLSKSLETGISSTISTAKNNVGQLRYEVIPLSRIDFDPENPRKLILNQDNLRQPIAEQDIFAEQKKAELEKLQSLANSIQKVGVRHAVEVYKDGHNYRLISGERRVLASMLAGKTDIQARILDHKPSTLDLRLLQWIENIEREDLSPYEKINNVKQLIDAYSYGDQTKINVTVLAEILGCSKQHASTLFAMLDAPQMILDALQEGKINNLEKAAFLSRIKDAETRRQLLDFCIQGQSLSALKVFFNRLTDDKHKKTFLLSKKGRPVTRISLGYVNNISSAKKIIAAVLALGEYVGHVEQFKNVQWSDPKEVSTAFKRLVLLLEKNETVSGSNT